MQATDLKTQQFGFVQQLARDLASGDVKLPSFPAVVVKIRDMLENEDVDFTQASDIVSTDPVLVSKLFVFANSSFHNRAGESMTSLEGVVSRLGLELVRSTALSLAVKQLMLAEEHEAIVHQIRDIWKSSMRLASLSYSIASKTRGVDEESAFMCGLLHRIGKLYILTRAKDFPNFLGDAGILNEIQTEWHAQVGKAIVDAWGFPDEVVQSMDPNEYFDEHTHLEPALVDIVHGAVSLLALEESLWPEQMEHAVWKKLGVDSAKLAAIIEQYDQKLVLVRESLT